MMNRPRLTAKIRPLVAAMGVLALIAVACGGDDATNASPDESAPVETPTTAEDEATDIEVDEAALQAILDQWRTGVDAFGATLSIRVPSHDDIHLASGVDNRDPETPMPTGGTYGIGTYTQAFVAAAALQLVDEGRLSLDEPVEAWLPELPNADEITLAMLLGFTSGLPKLDEATEQELITADLGRSFSPEELLALHLEQPPTAPPGEDLNRPTGDTGYIAAGLLIERELRQDLATVIEERFAQRLGLDDTLFGDGTTKPTRHGWFSLDEDPDRPIDLLALPHEALMTFDWANRNMISSSVDLLDWGEALYSGELLGEETTGAMLELRNSFSPSLHSGLGAWGFCLDQSGCDPDDVELVGLHGGLTGLETYVAHHPDSGVTFAVHANVNFGDGDLVTNFIDLEAAVLDQLGLA